MKCVRCFEMKWEIKDLQIALKNLQNDNLQLEAELDVLESRKWLKRCEYCPRDMVGHYEDCDVGVELSIKKVWERPEPIEPKTIVPSQRDIDVFFPICGTK